MIDKIIELICEEARRRPGNNLVLKLYTVMVDLDSKIIELMGEAQKSQRSSTIDKPLGSEDHYGGEPK